MPVVVDQRERAALGERHVAVALEATADPLELGERPRDRGVGTPTSRPTAMAASAFCTLCTPASANSIGSGPLDLARRTACVRPRC